MSASGDSVLSNVVTTGPIGWLAEFNVHPASNVLVVSVVVSIECEPRITPVEMQELLARLNGAIVFGAFLTPPGQSIVIYRSARDFPDGTSVMQVTKFLGQLNFPLSVWAQVSRKFPKGTDIQSRLDASLIRLDAHDGTGITRRTRRALLRLIRTETSPVPESNTLGGLSLL